MIKNSNRGIVEKVEPYFDQGLGTCEVWSIWGVLKSRGVNIRLLCLNKVEIKINNDDAKITFNIIEQLIAILQKLYNIKIEIRDFGENYALNCIQKTIEIINRQEPFIVFLGPPYQKPCIIRAYDLEQEQFLISEIGRDIPITLKEFQSLIENSPYKCYVQFSYPQNITQPDFKDLYSIMVDYLKSYAGLLLEIKKIPSVITNWLGVKLDTEKFRESYYYLLTHLSVQRKMNAAFLKELEIIYGEKAGAALEDSLNWIAEKWTVLRNIILKTKYQQMMNIIQDNEKMLFDLIQEIIRQEVFVYESFTKFVEGKNEILSGRS